MVWKMWAILSQWQCVKSALPNTSSTTSIYKWMTFFHPPNEITIFHWGRVMHISVSKLTTTGSDNGLSPGRHQAIIWTNAGILLIGPLGTNFCEILIEIHTFSFKKMHLKLLSGKWRPFCLNLNVIYGPSVWSFHPHSKDPWINVD